MHPILFTIGSYPVHTFGLMLMLGFAAALKCACVVAGRRPQTNGAPSPNDVIDATTWIILSGILGARLLYVALDWPIYKGHPWLWLATWEGGLSFHGAIAAGLIALVIFTRRRKIGFLKMVDVLAPAVMIGYAIGRIGCFFNGCCYGAPTNLPWGVRFYDNGHWTVPSHPTQLYSTLMSLVFFAILMRMERHQAFEGQLFGFYILFASIERFVMEIWRAGYTSTDIMAFGLTDAQYLCIGLFVFAIVLLSVLRRRKPAMPSTAAPPVGAVTP